MTGKVRCVECGCGAELRQDGAYRVHYYQRDGREVMCPLSGQVHEDPDASLVEVMCEAAHEQSHLAARSTWDAMHAPYQTRLRRTMRAVLAAIRAHYIETGAEPAPEPFSVSVLQHAETVIQHQATLATIDTIRELADERVLTDEDVDQVVRAIKAARITVSWDHTN